MAFAHHHAAQYDQGGGGETELFGAEQRHAHDVVSSFHLAVGLKAHFAAQPVAHERLLRLAQTNLRRDSGIPHR